MTASIAANVFAIGARVVLGLLGLFSVALGAGFLFIVVARPHEDDSLGTRTLVAVMGAARIVAGLSFIAAAAFTEGIFLLVGGIALVVGYGGVTIVQWIARRLGFDLG
jgi:hypothetical protein